MRKLLTASAIALAAVLALSYASYGDPAHGRRGGGPMGGSGHMMGPMGPGHGPGYMHGGGPGMQGNSETGRGGMAAPGQCPGQAAAGAERGGVTAPAPQPDK
ncbi:MAG: hypothetical protein V3V56_02470 [bacterium]